MPVPMVLLTGTIGAGKTWVAEAVADLLIERAVGHALVDLDWLGNVSPPPDPTDPHNMKVQIDAFSRALQSFLDAGVERFVLTATLESRGQRDLFVDLVRPTELLVVLVSASPEVVHDRIRRRENSERLLADFLARTDALAGTIESAGFHDLVVRNDPGAPDPATEITRYLGW